jgi:hypothetical protein
MTDYRMVARHVRYWRGVPHHWSTVYPLTGTLSSANWAAAIAALKTAEIAINYNQTATVGGGLYEIALYDQATGGVPVSVATYFDPTSVGSWIPYTSTAWPVRTFNLVSDAEAALQVEWAAGLSTSGKPVHFRKWYHSIPQELNAPGTADFTATEIANVVAQLTNQLTVISGLGAQLGRGSRLAATSPTVRQFAGNHQMPRGRRRPPVVSSTGVLKLPPGLLIVPGSDGSVP